MWGIDWREQKRGCGHTSQEVSAVVQEGNGDSLDWHGGSRDGERGYIRDKFKDSQDKVLNGFSYYRTSQNL